jgi:hypothetical protein
VILDREELGGSICGKVVDVFVGEVISFTSFGEGASSEGDMLDKA